MPSLYWEVVFAFSIIESVTGILLNSFIVILNILDWRQGVRWSLCDKMLVLIAGNNIFLQCDLNICTFLYIVFPQTVHHTNIYSATISALIIFQVYFSFWIMACLCIYYCLRIVSFKKRLFVHLKLKISVVVSKLLMVSAVGCFAISVLSIWNIDITSFGNLTNTSEMTNISIHFNPFFRILTILLGCCLPFVLAILSIVLTLSSLYTHTCSMKHRNSGFSIPRLDAHLRAARIMVLLTILFAVFYISQVYLLSSSMTIDSFWEVMALLFILIYPSVQSSTLILGNSKLRSACMRINRCDTR